MRTSFFLLNRTSHTVVLSTRESSKLTNAKSMSNQNEPAKTLLPYLQRADELQKHEPLVAYYCRLYAMERGLRIPQNERTKTTNSLLMSLIKQLEKDKKSLNLSPDDNLHVEGFALNVFAKADKQDRSGRADLNTAKTFYAASIFFEILNQFGPLPPDIELKQKYAAWKAADIRKALKEGRKPTPGGPAGDDDLSVPSIGPNGTYDHGGTDVNETSRRTEPDPPHDLKDGSSHNHFPQVPHSPPRFHNNPNDEHPTDVRPLQPPPSYHTTTYATNDLPPPTSRSDTPYPQPYVHQPYHQDPPQQHEPSPYSYPNFQSYPSFTESILPSTPSHYPSHYQSPEPYYSPQSALTASSTSFSSASPYSSSNERNSNAPVPDPLPSPAQKYQYDSSYQPSPEKVAEAHKAARFAVGALAFDDVSVAVDYLKKSLELLTYPSAGQ